MLDIDEAQQIAAEWISKEIPGGTLIGDPDEEGGKYFWLPGQGGTGDEHMLTDTPSVVVDENGNVGWGDELSYDDRSSSTVEVSLLMNQLRKRPPMADWANIQYNGESVGTLYTENGQAGFIPVVTSSAAALGYGIVFDAVKAAMAGGVPAADAYAGILHVLDGRSEFSYESRTGETVEKPTQDISGLLAFSVEELSTPYTAYTDDSGVVRYLTRETGDDSLVRRDGEWISLDDYDTEDLEVWPISEESVAIFDSLVSGNRVPTIKDLELAPLE